MEMKTLLAPLLVLTSCSASAQACVPASEIGRVIRENTANENTHHCESLKNGDKKHLHGNVDALQGVIISVDSGKQVATWSAWPQKGSRSAAIKTLPCGDFLSESEKLELTARDPKIQEGKSTLAKMLGNPCRRAD
jgi:hypothetical protein